MRLLCFLFIYAAASHAYAANLDQDYVRKLARARTSHEVARVTKDFEDLKVARAACRLQVRGKQLPAACYESLRLEIRWGLHPLSADRERLKARLDELCQDSTDALRVPRDLRDGPDLSPGCRKNLALARAIQTYKRGPDLEK